MPAFSLFQGDNFNITFNIEDLDIPDFLNTPENESLITLTGATAELTVRDSSKRIVIYKTITAFSADGKEGTFGLVPSDTVPTPPGTYKWDIRVTLADGFRLHSAEPSNLYIKESVAPVP